MVYFANKRRSPAQSVLRKVIGATAIAAIILLLWQVPYDILREERLRLFGETRTTGIVLESGTAADNGERLFLIKYKYIDNDGFARTALAPLPKQLWEQRQPGQRIEVFYVNGKADLSRVAGEQEPAFQLWLRDVLN
ncbi:hypothetical protein HFN16_01575 [Pseudodesulfovibrio sp. zrk46]|nr:hypothetical protein HFN16_01575 [Pseudodesulfovibrio sp. zrk46]